ncbi:hypothetical protein PR048_017158 [Dryococelus australis]|uniref:Uncharacterized protein n=1 Tax=Dryococelus australis TaxID=614101 RepID=A0ABQ9H9C8_9NEOP|nr:hypothetical protein PR048_017158 [Dryococelus australis]
MLHARMPKPLEMHSYVLERHRDVFKTQWYVFEHYWQRFTNIQDKTIQSNDYKICTELLFNILFLVKVASSVRGTKSAKVVSRHTVAETTCRTEVVLDNHSSINVVHIAGDTATATIHGENATLLCEFQKNITRDCREAVNRRCVVTGEVLETCVLLYIQLCSCSTAVISSTIRLVRNEPPVVCTLLFLTERTHNLMDLEFFLRETIIEILYMSLGLQTTLTHYIRSAGGSEAATSLSPLVLPEKHYEHVQSASDCGEWPTRVSNDMLQQFLVDHGPLQVKDINLQGPFKVSEETWVALNAEVLRADKDEAGSPRKPADNWHSVLTPPGIETGSPNWEANNLTPTPPLAMLESQQHVTTRQPDTSKHDKMSCDNLFSVQNSPRIPNHEAEHLNAGLAHGQFKLQVGWPVSGAQNPKPLSRPYESADPCSHIYLGVLFWRGEGWWSPRRHVDGEVLWLCAVMLTVVGDRLGLYNQGLAIPRGGSPPLLKSSSMGSLWRSSVQNIEFLKLLHDRNTQVWYPQEVSWLELIPASFRPYSERHVLLDFTFHQNSPRSSHFNTPLRILYYLPSHGHPQGRSYQFQNALLEGSTHSTGAPQLPAPPAEHPMDVYGCGVYPGERLLPECIVPTRKFGGGELMVWGCFTAFSVGPLVFFRGSMNTEAYCNILDNEMPLTLWRFYGMDPCYFQDDNARTRQARPKSIAQLMELLQEEWRRIPVDVLQTLVESIPYRVAAVIAAKITFTDGNLVKRRAIEIAKAFEDAKLAEKFDCEEIFKVFKEQDKVVDFSDCSFEIQEVIGEFDTDSLLGIDHQWIQNPFLEIPPTTPQELPFHQCTTLPQSALAVVLLPTAASSQPARSSVQLPRFQKITPQKRVVNVTPDLVPIRKPTRSTVSMIDIHTALTKDPLSILCHHHLESFVTKAYTNWKTALECFSEHAKTYYHQKCSEFAENFLSVAQGQQQPILNQISNEHARQDTETRVILGSIVDAIILCGRNHYCIIAALKHHGIQDECLIGQGYDGASSMSGYLYGDKAYNVRKECPMALYVHCSAHPLNLALAESCSLPTIRNCIEETTTAFEGFTVVVGRTNLRNESALRLHDIVSSTISGALAKRPAQYIAASRLLLDAPNDIRKDTCCQQGKACQKNKKQSPLLRRGGTKVARRPFWSGRHDEEKETKVVPPFHANCSPHASSQLCARRPLTRALRRADRATVQRSHLCHAHIHTAFPHPRLCAHVVVLSNHHGWPDAALCAGAALSAVSTPKTTGDSKFIPITFVWENVMHGIGNHTEHVCTVPHASSQGMHEPHGVKHHNRNAVYLRECIGQLKLTMINNISSDLLKGNQHSNTVCQAETSLRNNVQATQTDTDCITMANTVCHVESEGTGEKGAQAEEVHCKVEDADNHMSPEGTHDTCQSSGTACYSPQPASSWQTEREHQREPKQDRISPDTASSLKRAHTHFQYMPTFTGMASEDPSAFLKDSIGGQLQREAGKWWGAVNHYDMQWEDFVHTFQCRYGSVFPSLEAQIKLFWQEQQPDEQLPTFIMQKSHLNKRFHLQLPCWNTHLHCYLSLTATWRRLSRLLSFSNETGAHRVARVEQHDGGTRHTGMTTTRNGMGQWHVCTVKTFHAAVISQVTVHAGTLCKHECGSTKASHPRIRVATVVQQVFHWHNTCPNNSHLACAMHFNPFTMPVLQHSSQHLSISHPRHWHTDVQSGIRPPQRVGEGTLETPGEAACLFILKSLCKLPSPVEFGMPHY